MRKFIDVKILNDDDNMSGILYDYNTGMKLYQHPIYGFIVSVSTDGEMINNQYGFSYVGNKLEELKNAIEDYERLIGMNPNERVKYIIESKNDVYE